MKRTLLALTMSLCVIPGLSRAALADQVALPDTTLTADNVVSSDGSGAYYGDAAVTIDPFNAQYASSVVIQGTITGISNIQNNSSILEIGLMPRDQWNSETGAWNTGIYIVNWEAWGNGLSLDADGGDSNAANGGDSGPYVYDISTPRANNSNTWWHFTITLTPTGASGGSATMQVVVNGVTQTLLGDTAAVHARDLSDAVLAVQFLSSVQGATASFINLSATATALPLLPGDANNDGVVNHLDLIAVERHYGQTGDSNGLLPGDANDDGRVDGRDFLAVERYFGDALAASVSDTPEPGGALVFAVAGTALLIRRRRA